MRGHRKVLFRVSHCLHGSSPDSLARPREVRGAAPDWLFYALDRLNLSLSIRTVLSGSERIAADGSNPLRMSQMPRDSSQMVSGIAMMAATGGTYTKSRNSLRIPERLTRGPPMSPSRAMRLGTSPDRYIR